MPGAIYILREISLKAPTVVMSAIISCITQTFLLLSRKIVNHLYSIFKVTKKTLYFLACHRIMDSQKSVRKV